MHDVIQHLFSSNDALALGAFSEADQAVAPHHGLYGYVPTTFMRE